MRASERAVSSCAWRVLHRAAWSTRARATFAAAAAFQLSFISIRSGPIWLSPFHFIIASSSSSGGSGSEAQAKSVAVAEQELLLLLCYLVTRNNVAKLGARARGFARDCVVDIVVGLWSL